LNGTLNDTIDSISYLIKEKSDAVFLDMNLYDTIGGIEIKRKLESQFEIPVMISQPHKATLELKRYSSKHRF
jgi:hypothetical protein